jgi:biopolymer transport protein ExbB/TolQ
MGAADASAMLAGMPTWVQVAANLGIFMVAVAGAAYGFMQRFKGKPAVNAEASTYADGMKSPLGEQLLHCMGRIATSLEEALHLMRAAAREEEIEREVERRLEDERRRENKANGFRMDKEMNK